MMFRPLEIAGAYETLLERRGDARGYFARMFCENEFEGHGLNTHWAQMNLSFTQQKGTLRGLHFQRPPAAEVKLVRCLAGQALDVFVDLRAGSPTYGHHCRVTLDSAQKNAVYIPIGCAHGFQTLCDDVELQYFHSHAYAPAHECGIHPCDAALGIDWPLPVAQMSERDAALPLFSDCEPI